MVRSQNGWHAVTSGSSSKLASLRWITGKVNAGNVHTVLDELGRRFDAEVENIVKAHSWGYAYRDVRGASSLSNHASGTAVDFNAPAHALGRSGTFTNAQERAIRRILADLGGVVRWGGDYSGRKDEMHFEIHASEAAVAKVAARIKAGPAKPSTRAKPKGKKRRPKHLPKLRPGSRGGYVKLLQQALNDRGYKVGKADGVYGPKTEDGVRRFQRAAGLAVDGVVGPDTWFRLCWGARRGQGDTARVRIAKKVAGFVSVLGGFGPVTERRWKEIQRWLGVTDDGVVGANTTSALIRKG